MKISDGIYALQPSRGSLAYILDTGEGLTVVDPGSEPYNARIITRYADQKLGRPPKSIKNIFLTHWHGDHAGAAFCLRQMTGAQILCHRRDAPLLSGSQSVDTLWNIPMPRQGLNLFLQGICAAGYKTMHANTRSVVPDILFDEGPAPFDNQWTVINLPGHTPGSCGLWSESRRILFSGDTVIIMGRFLEKPFPFLIEDRGAMFQSWKRLNSLGEIEWILPGHFKPLHYRNVIPHY